MYRLLERDSVEREKMGAMVTLPLSNLKMAARVFQMW